jgi:hypothetical protein
MRAAWDHRSADLLRRTRHTSGELRVQGDYISAVVLLLLVLDPFGNIPIFIAALREVPADGRRRGIRSFVATL